ncbi:MAG: class I SAM-dependent methyltransferase, partial [Alicyclobacillus sp.]|nr:class I SAM-dependent methyltransferase [Alicyclobacillus sp.]
MSIHESKTVRVHAVFSQIARQYDRMNTLLSFWQHKRWRRFAMRHTRLPAGGRALDVACGTGDWTFALARQTGPAGEVVGLDFCQEMLDVARAKASRLDPRMSGRVRWVEGDAMRLPFSDGEFDVATIG